MILSWLTTNEVFFVAAKWNLLDGNRTMKIVLRCCPMHAAQLKPLLLECRYGQRYTNTLICHQNDRTGMIVLEMLFLQQLGL